MKILIIGAGPVGCYLARLLKQRGKSFSVSLIEEHASSGEPLHCAGLVSKAVFTEAQIKLPQDSIINYIHGAHIFLNGDSFQIKRKDEVIVLDRRRFDHSLTEGLDIAYNTRFIGLERDGLGYLVQTDRGDLRADIVIGADGANSALRRMINEGDAIEYYPAAQLRIKVDNLEEGLVKIYIRKPFFAWIIPESNTIARIGIISKSPYHELSDLLKEINLRGEILEKFGGILPLGVCRTQNDRLALVGDAACQVKPLTHGGIYYGMRCAEILCDCIAKNRLEDYEKAWRQKFGREIEIGLKIKRLFEGLDDDALVRLFRVLKKNKGVLERFADFDHHIEIMVKLMKIKGFQQLLGNLLLRLI